MPTGLLVRATVALSCACALTVAVARPAGVAQSASRVAVQPSRATGALGPLLNIAQTWNNCGPASVAEVLAYWGIERSQSQVAAVLRADGDPGGMGPFGVPGYATSLGLRAMLGVEGTPRLVKALISNGFPVIVNQWFSVWDHVRHYRPIEAYDDRAGVFVSSDPYGGQDYAITYANFGAVWSISNGRFMVIYPPSRQAALSAVLESAGWHPARAYADDATRQQARLRRLGSSVGHMYGYLNLAWDDLELGRDGAARLALRAASLHGAKPIVVGWVAAQLRARAP